MKLPTTQIEAIRYFSDVDRCIAFVAQMRWPDGVVCPTCGRTDVSYLKTQKRWQCKSSHAKRQFSVKAGTIFEDSALGLDKWLPAIWNVVNAKNGISSYGMARNLGITQKSAWFMDHRIREAMNTGTVEKLSGEIEADETFPDGKPHNMHKSKLAMASQDRRRLGSTVVFGMLERGGRVKAMVVADRKGQTLWPEIGKHVEMGATVYTDAHWGYAGLKALYEHKVIDHHKSYVEGNTHTNGIEGYWNLVKRSHILTPVSSTSTAT